MTKKILFGLPIIWFAAACSPIASIDCPPYTLPVHPCKGDPKTPQVTINTASANLKATPGCVKTNQETFIIFRLVPHDQNDLGTVEIFPKDEAKTPWLAGTNDPYKDLIIISVPDDATKDKHDYGIRTSTKCVDPRVSVE